MESNDSLVLNELAESGSSIRPSVQVEQALAEIKDTYQTAPFAKIPFTEIAALGGSFAGVAETLAGCRGIISLRISEGCDRNAGYG